MDDENFLSSIKDPDSIITPIDSTIRFPEVLTTQLEKYKPDIDLFCQLIGESSSSAELLAKIRMTNIPGATRMSLLKMFRRCVAPVLDTEKTKKITAVTTESLVSNYGATFKPIEKLKQQFSQLSPDTFSALAVLIGEYDTRGQQGYQLTEAFFDWFEATFSDSMSIEGPRRAGRDVELSTVFPDFTGSYPCDFVIRDKSAKVLCIGFARYDSTRGGAQSDDRTGGNANKVTKAHEFSNTTGNLFKLLFVSDGPGLTHKDTWQEACLLDGMLNDNVRVTTLKTAPQRVTSKWLLDS